MTVISRFHHITISMVSAFVPSIVAQFGRDEAVFSLYTGEMIEIKGEFPDKEASIVTAWILVHQKALMTEFTNVKNGLKPGRISSTIF